MVVTILRWDYKPSRRAASQGKSKPWYPNGTQSHSWFSWMVIPRNMVMTGFDPPYWWLYTIMFLQKNPFMKCVIPFVTSYNVNPGLINHGLLIRGYFFYGTLPIQQPFGLWLIQGWHSSHTGWCPRSIAFSWRVYNSNFTKVFVGDISIVHGLITNL